MVDLFHASYLWLDLLVGLGSPCVLFLAVRRGAIERRWWHLYWIGAAVGLTWELPIFALSAWSGLPIVTWPTGLPVPPMVLMVSHTLWDGTLFLVGVWLVRVLCRREALRSFRPVELAILLAWGQFSELLVELSATGADAWAWVPSYRWNPVLFGFNGHAITLVPQLIWLAAPLLYYWLVLRYQARSSSASASSKLTSSGL